MWVWQWALGILPFFISDENLRNGYEIPVFHCFPPFSGQWRTLMNSATLNLYTAAVLFLFITLFKGESDDSHVMNLTEEAGGFWGLAFCCFLMDLFGLWDEIAFQRVQAVSSFAMQNQRSLPSRRFQLWQVGMTLLLLELLILAHVPEKRRTPCVTWPHLNIIIFLLRCLKPSGRVFFPEQCVHTMGFLR